MSGKGSVSVWAAPRLDAAVTPTRSRAIGKSTMNSTSDDQQSLLLWSLSEAEGSAVSVDSPLPENHHKLATIQNHYAVRADRWFDNKEERSNGVGQRRQMHTDIPPALLQKL